MYFDLFIFVIGLITTIVYAGDYIDYKVNKTEIHGLEWLHFIIIICCWTYCFYNLNSKL